MRHFAPEPVRVFLPGKCYRYEPVTSRHEMNFYQFEFLAVGPGITMGDLKGTLQRFAEGLFGKGTNVRLRPSYFPFTEPSAELDVSCNICMGKGCTVCKYTGWLELGGCGMVHPTVLRNGGYDPDVVSGFAGGFGFDIPQPFRTTLLRLVLRSDSMIRLIYTETCGRRCPALDEAGIDQWRRPFQVAGAEPAVFDVLNAGIPALPVATLEQLAKAPFPKSVVYGANDPEYAPGSAAQTAARIGAPAPTLIPNARHLTMISDPSVVAAAIERLAASATH